jgi:hypothetical protein
MVPIDGNGNAKDDPEDFIDPEGYWADTKRNVRRRSGEQEVVFIATEQCTKGEWIFVLESLGIQENT